MRDAKYGIPLHKTPQPPRPWQGITHMPEAELPIRRPAPLVSPAETPELAHIRAPAPAIPLLSSEDCYKDDEDYYYDWYYDCYYDDTDYDIPFERAKKSAFRLSLGRCFG